MDEQNQTTQQPEQQGLPRLTPEQVAMLKQIAFDRAQAQTILEQQNQTVRIAAPPPSMQPPQPQPRHEIVYLRRNLTVAELLLVVLLACGLVTGVQALWGLGSRILPQVEIRVK
jgi:hypothetical protein